jgi:hypothetical protein
VTYIGAHRKNLPHESTFIFQNKENRPEREGNINLRDTGATEFSTSLHLPALTRSAAVALSV